MKRHPCLSPNPQKKTLPRSSGILSELSPFRKAGLLLLFLIFPGSAGADGGNYRSLFALADASSPPEIEISEQEVIFTAATPGAEVVWLGLWRSFIEESVTRVDRYLEVLPDSDKDGRVSAKFDGAIPAASVWVALDLGSGVGGVAAPSGSKLRLLAPQDRRLVALDAEIEVDVKYLEVVLVRPKVGVWRQTVRDGTLTDRQARPDGKVRLALEEFEPVGRTRDLAPKKFEPTDLLVGIDPTTFRVFDLRRSP